VEEKEGNFKGILKNMNKKKDESVNYVQATSVTNPTSTIGNLIWRYNLESGWGWEVEENVPETSITTNSSWKFPNSDERIDDLAFQIQCLIKEVKKLRKVIQKTIEDAGNDTK